MVYEYSGYLKAILSAPDEAQRDQTDHIAFGPDDLAHWTTTDLPAFTEWLRIPVSRSRTDHAVELKGKFEDVRRIDYLASDEPTYWVPLGTLGVRDDRFPIDLNRFPIRITQVLLNQIDHRFGHVHRLIFKALTDALAPAVDCRPYTDFRECTYPTIRPWFSHFFSFPTKVNSAAILPAVISYGTDPSKPTGISITSSFAGRWVKREKGSYS